MKERFLDILLKSEEEQIYAAKATTNSTLLDVLANSDSISVKLQVLANPNVGDNTLSRLIGDEEKLVWQRTQDLIESRKKLA